MTDKPTSLSRRDVLKKATGGAALIASTAAIPGVAQATTQTTKRYAMVIDTRRCVGCHACTIACKTEFDVPLGVNRSWVESIEKGNFPHVKRNFLPRLCNQCERPPCVWVCPVNATHKRKEDGIVTIDSDICIGCKYCIQACPYGARFINPKTGSADKCDFCLHRVREGLAPACVNTCQGRARIFGDLNDPTSEVSRVLSTNSVTVLRPEMGTEPMVFYIDADHTDERDAARTGQYVRVETHRPNQERV